MAPTMSNEAKITIKVTVDKQKNKVVYAEADHTFVDVLFSFMTLPLGSIARVLNKQSDQRNIEALKSLNNLYQSLVDLPDRFFFNEECKYTILNPRSSTFDLCRKLKVNIDDTEPERYYLCESWKCVVSNRNFSNYLTASCGNCGKRMNQEISIKDGDICDVGGVFVSDVSTYIVTDDLLVMPYTPGSCIQLLQNLGVTDAIHLEEKTVDIGYQQIVDLLRLSLSCDSPLTYLVLYPSRDLSISQLDVFDICPTSAENIDARLFLRVSLQKSTGKLLFAETEGDFVDFVSGFLAISLGTVIGNFENVKPSLLCSVQKKESSLFCMDNIFKSISNISEEYFRSKALKDILLEPHFGRQYYTKNKIFPLYCSNFPTLSLDMDTYLIETVTSESSLSYSSKYITMTLIDPKAGNELLIRSGMFMLTDDLVITPSSSVSTMNILSKFNVPLNDIERHKVSIGLKEGISMLKSSLISSSALSKGLEHQLKILKQST